MPITASNSPVSTEPSTGGSSTIHEAARPAPTDESAITGNDQRLSPRTKRIQPALSTSPRPP